MLGELTGLQDGPGEHPGSGAGPTQTSGAGSDRGRALRRPAHQKQEGRGWQLPRKARRCRLQQVFVSFSRV